MMKRHSLSNKVRNSILAAILLQSVVFGIGLGVSGTFTSTAGSSSENQTRTSNARDVKGLKEHMRASLSKGGEISSICVACVVA